jgi:hypothetical protein
MNAIADMMSSLIQEIARLGQNRLVPAQLCIAIDTETVPGQAVLMDSSRHIVYSFVCLVMYTLCKMCLVEEVHYIVAVVLILGLNCAD